MSRTRLIVSAILIVILGLIAAPTSWAGGLKTVPTTVTTAVGFTPTKVLLADVNNDTKTDLLVAECGATGQVEVFQGNGDGTFTLKATLSTGASCPQSLAVGQLSTGAPVVPEIVVGDNGGNVTVFQDDGTATFKFTTIFGPYPVGSNISGVAIGDMDGDTKPDVVASDFSGSVIWILLGDGTGSLGAGVTPAFPPSQPVTGYPTGTNPNGVVIADFDGANGNDVATVDRGSNTVTVLLNKGVAAGDVQFASTTPTGVGNLPTAIATGVLRSGAKPDIVVANATDKTVSVLQNNGTGTFTVSSTPSVLGNPNGIALGNFSTHLAAPFNDIIVSQHTATEGAQILFNDGTGAFPNASPNFAAGTSPDAIAVGFIDGDTWLDAAVANGGTNSVSIFLGTPFSAVTPQPVSAVEGVALPNPTPLLTFKYDNSPSVTQFLNPPATTKVDNWGDGSNTIPNVVGPNGSGVYTVQDETGKKYADEVGSPFDISLTINNNTDSQSYVITPTSIPASAQATVADAPLTAIPVPDPVAQQAKATPLTAVIAKFSDQNTGALATDFDQPGSTVNYGDLTTGTCSTTGGTANCTIAADVAPGTFKVTPNHTYAADGVYTITVNIADVGGSTVGPMVTHVSITQLSLNTNSLPISAVEFQAPAADQTLGTFSTARGGDKAKDFSLTINWGDGNTDSCIPGNTALGQCDFAGTGGTTSGMITGANGGPYTIKGHHTYSVAAPATKTITVTVTDPADANTTLTFSGNANITEAPLVKDNAAIAPQNATEGAPAATFNAGVFWDEDTAEATPANYSITIHWGDGTSDTSPSANVIVTGPTAGTDPNGKPAVKWVVTGKHSYAEGGKDAGGTCTVANPAACNITVDVTDTEVGGSSITTNNAPINVSDASLVGTPIAINAGVVNVTVFVGKVATWVDNNPAATDLTDYPAALPAVTIDFKDGLVVNCLSGGNAPIPDPSAGLVADTCEYYIDNITNLKTVVAKHKYTSAVTQTVITINDKGGATVTVTDTVTITTISSTTPVTNVPVVEGVNMSPDLVGTFVTQRAGAVAADFNAAGTSINWGDGTPVDNAPSGNISIVQNPPGACPCTFEIHGTHAFASINTPGPVTRNITVNIKDSIDNSTATINSTASESDAAINGVAPPASPLAATEGVKIAAGTVVGRFLDANPAALATDYSDVVVHWNDPNNAGQTSSLSAGQLTLAAVGGSPGEFDIKVNGANGYQYHEVSNPVVTFDVTDKGGQTSTAQNGVTFNVADAKPLVAGAALQIDKNNGGGQPLVAGVDNFTGNNGKVATFTDPNPFALVGDFNISIDWGDGVIDNCPAPCANVTQPGGVGTVFNVTPGAGHIFQKAGSQLTAVLVTITDKSDLTNTITVNDGVAKVTSISANTPVLNVPVTEGVPMAPDLAGTFVSQRAGAVAADFNAAGTSINWGDGSPVDNAPTPNFTIVQNPPGACPCTFEVHGPHAFVAIAVPGPVIRNITVSIKDSQDGSTTIINSTASESDAALTPQAPPASPLPAVEGVKIAAGTVVGRFLDGNPNALATDYTDVVVHWNDPNNPGTTSSLSGGQLALVSVGPGLFDIQVVGANGYQYREVSNPQVTFDVTDKGGTPPIIGAPGVVFNVADNKPLVGGAPLQIDKNNGGGALLLAGVDNFTGNAGRVATFTDPNPFALTNDFNISIDWGDGTPPDVCNAPCANVTQPGGVGTLFDVSPGAGHIFQKAGTQLTPVLVTITDKSDLTNTITVNDGPAKVTSLTGPVFANIGPVEGVAFAGGVGQFTSTTGSLNFSASINWGDGNINNATGFAGGPPTWTVNGTNTYTDEDPIKCGAGCAITVTVTDLNDGSTLIISGGKANVLDAPLTVVAVPGIIAQAGQALNNVVVGQFQDANPLATTADFTGLAVHWNDPNNPGSPTAGAITQVGPGMFQIRASYPAGYSINGNYQITFDVADIGAAKCVVPGQCVIAGGAGAAITNSPGILTGAGKNLQPASGLLTGIIATFSNTNPALPITDYSGTVNWGDGSPVEACSSSSITTPNCFYQQVSPGNFSVTGSHTYLQLGQTFPITVVVNDAIGGATVTINSTAAIPNIILTDFLGGASPPQSQIPAGQALDLLVTLSPNPNTPAFNKPVVFTGCTILSGPAKTGLVCSFNPTQVPNVLQVYQVHVTVQSFTNVAMNTAPATPGRNRQLQLALLLPAFVGTFGVVLLGSKKNRRRTLLWWAGSLLLLALLLVGCGGGPTVATPTGGNTATVPGTYLLQVNTNAGSAVGPCNVNGTGPCITAQVTIK